MIKRGRYYTQETEDFLPAKSKEKLTFLPSADKLPWTLGWPILVDLFSQNVTLRSQTSLLYKR